MEKLWFSQKNTTGTVTSALYTCFCYGNSTVRILIAYAVGSNFMQKTCNTCSVFRCSEFRENQLRMIGSFILIFSDLISNNYRHLWSDRGKIVCPPVWTFNPTRAMHNWQLIVEGLNFLLDCQFFAHLDPARRRVYQDLFRCKLSAFL